MSHWSVIRTRARWEKKVMEGLRQKGIEVFCPLQKTRRRWSDRMKTVETPLLKSFVFARVKADQRTTVRLTEGVVNFVYRSGKPVVLKDKLLQGIRQFQETHSEVEVVDIMEQVWVNEDRQGNCGRFAEKQKTASLRLDTLNLVLIARSARPVTTEAKTDKNETCAFFKA